MDDAALIAAFLEKRSEDAFRRLVQRHTDMVYAACLRGLNGDIHAAEDATQSVFVVLTKRAKSIRNPAVLGGWLFRTARFVMAHMKQEAARRRFREEKAAMDKQDGGTGKDEGQWDEVKPHLNDVLAFLPAPQQKALVLHYLEGKTVREVANALASSENTIKKRIQYGLEKLRRRLSKKGVPVSAALITTCLSTKVIHAAPPGLAASCHAAAWQSLISGAVASSSSSLVIAKGAMKMMMWAKVKLVATCVIAAAVVGVGTPVAVRVMAQGNEEKRVEKATGEYAKFNKFCIEHWGAEKEPLLYDYAGKDLKTVKDGFWTHFSENSACIAWETNLPAKTYVEYGETKKYGKKTEEPERNFFLHVHYLKGLETGKTYHYRLVSTDERGNKVVTENATFETKKVPGAVYIPGDLGEPPYVLDKANTTYVLKKDIPAQTKGFGIKAKGVVLDLNGHTLTYDEGEPKVKAKKWSEYAYSDEATFGIRCLGKQYTDVKILNGIIIQGKNNGKGVIGYGFNPIYMKYMSAEIAGITAIYSGDDVNGITIHNNDDMHIHHNVVLDKGTHVTDRHQGISALTGDSSNKVHHNLIKRCRQIGIGVSNGSRIYSNEVYIDSWPSNSTGIGPGNDSETYDNRVFGTGDAAQGIYAAYRGSKNRKIRHNYIEVFGAPPYIPARSLEYKKGDKPQQNRVKCIRLHFSKQENIEIYDNTLVAKGKKGAHIRCFMNDNVATGEVVIRDNVLKYVALDETVQGSAVAAIHAARPKAQKDPAKPIVYRNNTIISNLCNVSMADYYNSARYPILFENNRLVRLGNLSTYHTVNVGYWIRDCFGLVFVDTEFADGASFDAVRFSGTGARRDFSVGWTLAVKTAPGAKVTITDKTGKEVFAGVADVQGKVSVPLMQYIHKPDGKTALTPHTVKVDKAGKTAEKQVTMDKKREVKL